VSTYQLEVGVPIPRRARGRSGSKYPFHEMEVGQSFLADAETKASTLRSAVGAYLKRSDAVGKFAVRVTDDGVRVWRIE
jgi:hypothetical protein